MNKTIVGVRFDEETARAIQEVVESLGIDKSDFIRLAVREKLAQMSYLDEKAKKALGMIQRGDKR